MTISILDCLEWTDPVKSSVDLFIHNPKNWIRSDIVPEPGQIRLVSCPYWYKIDNITSQRKYLFYQPALSSINGYDKDYIDEINDFHIVDADISEIACELKDSNNQRSVWYLVKVHQVFNFKDFQLLIPNFVTKPDRFRLKECLEWKRSLYYFSYHQWNIIELGDEYWGLKFILSNVNNEFILVFLNEWYGTDEDESFITNYKLTVEESNIVKRLIENSN